LETILDTPSQRKSILIVKTIENEVFRLPGKYRGQRCTLGIDDFPVKPSSDFLNYFCKGKTLAFFDLRNQGRIVQEAVEILMKFSAVLPTVIIVVATDIFGRAIEENLRARVGVDL